VQHAMAFVQWLVLVSCALASASAPSTAPAAAAVCAKNCSTDINATRTFRRWPEPNLVPWPTTITASAAYTVLTSISVITVQDSSAIPLGHLLADELAALTGGALNLSVVVPPAVAVAAGAGAGSATLKLVLEPGSQDFYSLEISTDVATLTAATYEGLAAATTTVLQSLEHDGDDDGYPSGPFNCSTVRQWRLPHLVTRDSPEFSYRGLMVDCARKPVPLVELKAFVVLCRFYKLNCQ
jgi:N-acetyl-beta-hexosaminidase